MINQRILEIKSQYPEVSEYSLPESFKGLGIDYMYKVEYIYRNDKVAAATINHCQVDVRSPFNFSFRRILAGRKFSIERT
jgi:hypothetical protein